MWHAGIPAEFSFEPMMEEKIALYKAKKVYRVVSVIQPPFMQWNETLSKQLQSIEEYYKALNKSRLETP